MSDYVFYKVVGIKGETREIHRGIFENDMEASACVFALCQKPEFHDTHVLRCAELSEHGTGIRSVCQAYSDEKSVRVIRSLAYKATAGEWKP